MAYCNNTVRIEPSEFLASSLFKINTNYTNLDIGICELGKEIISFEAFIRTLSAKDTSTIDISFSNTDYLLSADIINNSLGTSKLGVDIPQTTKTFLTAVMLSSIDDVDIKNVRLENVLRWNGTKWLNSSLVDEIGAQRLYELVDTEINNEVNEQVIKYDTLLGKWTNNQETGLSAIPNGDYEDINVSGEGFNQGLFWNIRPSRVNTLELEPFSITNDIIAPETITNNKFANNTIEINKCNFDPGEANNALTLGSGAPGSYDVFKQKVNTTFEFKKIRGILGCQVNEYNDRIVIYADQPPDPTPPVGANLPSIGGAGIFKDVTNENRYRFKTLKEGSGGIVIEETETEITISRPIYALGLTLPNVDENGNPLSFEDLKSVVTDVYPPNEFVTGTKCYVLLQHTTNIEPIQGFEFNIPLTLEYDYKKVCVTSGGGICGSGKDGAGNVCSPEPTTTTCYMFFQFTDPAVDWQAPSRGAPLVTVTGTKNMETTITIPQLGSLKLPFDYTTQTFTVNNSEWV